MAESRLEKRVSALELELEAAQTDLKIEKLRSHTTRERIIVLENEIRVVFDIISNLSIVRQESLSKIRQKIYSDVDASPESTNILAQSREMNNTFSGIHQELLEKQQFRSALSQNSNSLSPLEVETVREGQIPIPENLWMLEDEVETVPDEVQIVQEEAEMEYAQEPDITFPILEPDIGT